MKRVDVVLRNEAGFSLFATFLVMIVLMSLGSGSIIATILDLKGTSSFRTGNMAFSTADAGVLHAIREANSSLVIDFQSEVVDQWDNRMGTDWYSMPANENLTYKAEPLQNQAWCASDNRQGPVRITGRAPNEAERQIDICLSRAPFNFNWGAIYLGADTIDATINGNALSVTGFDTNENGTSANNGVAVPAVGLRTDSAEQDLRAGISGSQADNFAGFGDTPPSIHSTGGPTPDDLLLLSTAINTALGGSAAGDANPSADGGLVTWLQSNPGGTVSGGEQYGSTAAPQVTLIDADGSNTVNGAGSVRVNGNVSGTGILIVDGDVSFSGNIDWTGWVVSSGNLELSGNATVKGSVWASGFEFTGRGSMTVDFCTYCLALAVSGLNLEQLPSTVEVTAWRENTWWQVDPGKT